VSIALTVDFESTLVSALSTLLYSSHARTWRCHRKKGERGEKGDREEENLKLEDSNIAGFHRDMTGSADKVAVEAQKYFSHSSNKILRGDQVNLLSIIDLLLLLGVVS
jgi:hypothetical protein